MNIVLIGGDGYLGSALQQYLEGHEIRTLGISESANVTADIRNRAAITEACAGADVVVNLVGLSPLFEPHISYTDIHVGGVENVVYACKNNAVSYLVHISALGADPNGPTEYLRTKGQAENRILQSGLDYLLVRPSMLVDEASEAVAFFGKFSWTRMFAKTDAHIQPVLRSAAASWIAQAIQEHVTGVHELAGPHIIALCDFVKLLYALHGRSCVFLPSWTAHLSVSVLAKLPRTRITADQVRSLDLSNTLQAGSDAHQHIIGDSVFSWALQQT